MTPIQGAAGPTSTTLGDDKTNPEGKKVVCKPVQKICGSKLLTPKRKLHQTLDVGSPQKRIKIKTSPNFSRCLNFWKCKENIHTRSGPADLTVRSFKSSGGKMRNFHQSSVVVIWIFSPGGNQIVPQMESQTRSDIMP
jgi:hypothetical protein